MLIRRTVARVAEGSPGRWSSVQTTASQAITYKREVGEVKEYQHDTQLNSTYITRISVYSPFNSSLVPHEMTISITSLARNNS